MGKYYDLNLKSDTLLLAYIFEKCTTMGLEIYNLDPAKFRSAHGLQSAIKYLRLTLVFDWNSAGWESLISIFQDAFRIDKIFILAGVLHTRVSFYEA